MQSINIFTKRVNTHPSGWAHKFLPVLQRCLGAEVKTTSFTEKVSDKVYPHGGRWRSIYDFPTLLSVYHDPQ